MMEWLCTNAQRKVREGVAKKNVENFQRGEKFWKQKQKQAEAGIVPSSSLVKLS